MQPRTPSEKRMSDRLTRYWNALRGDEPYARVAEFNVGTIPGFGDHAFILDLSRDPEDPVIHFAGKQLSAECGCDVAGNRLSIVPTNFLLGRIAKHYRQVIEQGEPCEFADEYEKDNKDFVLYRGTLLPFTGDGTAIDYIVGAVTSKTIRPEAPAPESPAPESLAPESPEAETLSGTEAVEGMPGESAGEIAGPAPVQHDGQHDGQGGEPKRSDEQDARGLIALVEAEIEAAEPAAEPGPLQATLQECRGLAAQIDVAESRSRKALYDTLERVYAFHLDAEAEPAAFEALTAAAGLAVQARAPFTPIVKLVFGVDYDKTRLSEYATALSYARRRNQTATGFRGFLEAQDGGLKGCVKAERAARRAERGAAPDRTEEARALLRGANALGQVTEPEPGTEEFVLVLGRRTAAQPGVIELLGVLDEKPAVLEGMLRRGARKLQVRAPSAPETEAGHPAPGKTDSTKQI